MTKLEVAEKYSWLIIEAFAHRIRELEKVIKDMRETLANPGPDCPKILLRSLEGGLEHCEWLLTINLDALKELKEAGWR